MVVKKVSVNTKIYVSYVKGVVEGSIVVPYLLVPLLFLDTGLLPKFRDKTLNGLHSRTCLGNRSDVEAKHLSLQLRPCMRRPNKTSLLLDYVPSPSSLVSKHVSFTAYSLPTTKTKIRRSLRLSSFSRKLLT